MQAICDHTQAIDLSINALSTISLELFKLPRLRNLYYNHNILLHINHDLQSLERPIVAPLQKINLAGCRLSALPDFGILPELVHLNISNNAFDQITPQQFSPFCQLKFVVIENSTLMSPCMCKSLQSYFDRRLITIRDTFDCPTIHEGTKRRTRIGKFSHNHHFNKAIDHYYMASKEKPIEFLCISYYRRDLLF